MATSKIEWTDKTWNPVTGCTKVSQGCKNCYAEKMYERFHTKGSFKIVVMHHDRLSQPADWKKPCKIFVNSMSDLFHEEVSFVFINAIFSVMSDWSNHIFQVLTKRPQRMLEFFEWKYRQFNIQWEPSDNVWLGVSVEDQATANERIHYLNYIPAAVKFLSCEPLLGPIDFEKSIGESLKWHAGGLKNCISWIIVGGESGPGARPMHPDWARSIRDQCEAAGVPFFFKQWGEFGYFERFPIEVDYLRKIKHYWSDGRYYIVEKSTPAINITNFPIACRLGKKAAGNHLDGKQYLEFPKTKNQLIS